MKKDNISLTTNTYKNDKNNYKSKNTSKEKGYRTKV